jgi:hypothetical protein
LCGIPEINFGIQTVTRNSFRTTPKRGRGFHTRHNHHSGGDKSPAQGMQVG